MLNCLCRSHGGSETLPISVYSEEKKMPEEREGEKKEIETP